MPEIKNKPGEKVRINSNPGSEADLVPEGVSPASVKANAKGIPSMAKPLEEKPMKGKK